MKSILLFSFFLGVQLVRAQSVSTSAGASAATSITVVSTIPASAVDAPTAAASTAAASTAAASTAAVATRSAGRAMSTVEKTIATLERQRFAAQLTKNYAVLDKVLANDLVYTHSNGNTDTKQAYIQSIRDGKLSYEAIDLEELNVRIYGTTAIVNGVCTIKAMSNGQSINSRARYTDVYVRKGNQWQLAAWQSTRLAQ